MSDRDFDKFVFENMRSDSPTFENDRSWALKGYKAAVEHCKQGEPVASIIFNEDEEYTCMPIGREVFKLAPNVEHKLFTHAMPKSDEVYELRAKNAYLLAQLKTNSIPPQPPCDNDHVADGCEKFTTTQPSTDVSELVQAKIDDCAYSKSIGMPEYRCAVKCMHNEYLPKRLMYEEIVEIMDQLKIDPHLAIFHDFANALIAKHTVK